MEHASKIEEDSDFFITTRLKHVRRFLCNELSNLTTQYNDEETLYKARISPLIRDMFERFYQNREHWLTAVKCMAEMDALCSLALVSNAPDMVRPVVHGAPDQVEAQKAEKDSTNKDDETVAPQRPFLKIEGMRHPLLEHQELNEYVKQFVANDVSMDFETSRCLLITGPNMGGKSTTLRSACLLVIMAQIGCYVPATKCELTVVDQIFTRLGACDRILESKSTFFLELEETKFLLDNATENSLIIMDELGRGTSTFDGYALARSVLAHLVNVI